MQDSHTHHPDPELLAAYAAGQNVGLELEHVEAHLSNCDFCAATLAKTETASESVQRIGEALRSSPCRREFVGDRLQMIIERLQPSPHSGAIGRLGSYHLLTTIGQGAFGSVFRAFDETLHRQVAVKVLSPEFTEKSPARQRFLREARSAAAIRHENVVRIHAVAEQPLPHLVMEFVPGESLQSRLDRIGSFSSQEVVAIGIQVAQGLAAAHRLGLIHRDIKPANILVEQETPEVRVHLTDFGLARTVDDTLGVTTERLVMGTPAYMSPEQVNADELDHRSDLFSLGSVLYTLCCGRLPFTAPTLAGVLKQVVDAEPAAIESLNPSIDPQLIYAIRKMMKKSPGDRFQSAEDVVAELMRVGSVNSRTNEPRIFVPASNVKRVGSNILRSTLRRAMAVILPVIVLVTAFVIRTNNGEFVLTTDDPEIAARITQAGGLVVEDTTTKTSYTLTPGENRLPNGDYELVVTAPDGLEITTPKFQLKRLGGSIRATVFARPTTESRDALESAPMQMTTAEWSEPERVEFPGGEVLGNNACISGDGLRLVFVNRTGGVTRLSESARSDRGSPFGTPVDMQLTAQSDDAKFGERCGTPWLSINGLDLLVYYFEPSYRNGAEIWQTHRESLDSPWQPLQPLGPEVNSDGHDYSPNMSADGLTLFWFRPKETNVLDGDLWTASRSSTADSFTNAKQLGDGINTEAAEQHPFVTADGLSLFFDSGTPDPRLWQSRRMTTDEEFTAAKPVEFPQSWRQRCAYAPSLTSDGKLLIFTSNVAPGKEGFDTGVLWQTRWAVNASE